MTTDHMGATLDHYLRIMKSCIRELDSFLPGEFAQDRERFNQARIFLLSHLVGPIIGSSAPIAFYSFDPTPGPDILVLLASVLGFWLFLPLMRWGVCYHWLVRLSIANLHFAIFWGCYHNGGVASPTLVWVLIIPILSVFYVGGDDRMRVELLGMSLLLFAAFFVTHLVIPPGPNDLPYGAQVGLGATAVLATLCYVAAMAIYYGRIYDAGVTLEAEVKRRQCMAAELREAVIAANRASAAKSDFLARMSHELRTPLNAILGYGQLLQEEADDTGDAHLRQDIDHILDAGHYLLRLINMILDLSKIEVGQMNFDLRTCALGPLVRDIVEHRREMIEARGNSVVLHLEDAPQNVTTDTYRLRDILDGILENAAQHTQNGTITVSAKATWREGKKAFSVAIADTGDGFTPEAAESVFETFSKRDDAALGQYGGTGLNLTVSSSFCRAMGGTITVRSALGEGSTFAVTLPAISHVHELAPVSTGHLVKLPPN